MDVIGIKLSAIKFSPECYKILLNYQMKSIADVKRIIENREYLLSCDYSDTPGIQLIIDFYNELKENDIRSVLYERDMVTNVNSLQNLVKTNEIYGKIN